jgi:cytoskeletal protein CcmA (bactofilin family)
MSLWKDSTPSKPKPATPDARDTPRVEPAVRSEPANFSSAPQSEPDRPRKESVIAADLTIEGKIEGSGSVRIAGTFKGDIRVQGDLTVESGARVNGAVRADKVVIAGELEGNVEGAKRVELQAGGSITGDVTAGAFTVAAGSRMRGQVAFGWEDAKPVAKSDSRRSVASAEPGAAA